MDAEPTSLLDTPTEAAFLKQADIARDALRNFTTVSGLINAPNIIRPALHDVLNATVRLFIFALSFSPLNFY
jgi:hypothetical protein